MAHEIGYIYWLGWGEIYEQTNINHGCSSWSPSPTTAPYFQTRRTAHTNPREIFILFLFFSVVELCVNGFLLVAQFFSFFFFSLFSGRFVLLILKWDLRLFLFSYARVLRTHIKGIPSTPTEIHQIDRKSLRNDFFSPRFSLCWKPERLGPTFFLFSFFSALCCSFRVSADGIFSSLAEDPASQ